MNHLPIEKYLGFLSNPLRLGMEDFIRDDDVQTSITLLRIELGSRIHRQQFVDPDMTLGALFDDSNDENWGAVESRWADILFKHQKKITAILDRREELLLLDSVDTSLEDEEEYEELGKQLEISMEDFIREVNHDIDGIISGLRDIPQIKF